MTRISSFVLLFTLDPYYTYQIVARVRAMATLVRLGARVEAHVSLQMRSDLSSKCAARVRTRAEQIRFRRVLRPVVACTVAGKKRNLTFFRKKSSEFDRRKGNFKGL